MKVLFIPYFNGGRSHQIPLYVFCQRYFTRTNNFSTAFLLPASDHVVFEKGKINVLNIDYSPPDKNDFDTEAMATHLIDEGQKAINSYRPDIVVEDLDFTAKILCEKYSIPCISIERTGLFRSSDPLTRSRDHVHSMERNPENDQVRKILGYKVRSEPSHHTITYDENYYLPELVPIKQLSNKKYRSGATVIPGISTIEVLPAVADLKSYFYCGPLNVKDRPSESLSIKLNQFLLLNRQRKKVFVTMGLVEQQDLSEILSCLLELDYAVITTIPYPSSPLTSDKLFFNSTLPLDYTCSVVDLIIHHCGSGMYHYPLVNTKPTITLGTRCYDREEVALQLEKLSLSAHTPSPQDNPKSFEIFRSNLEKFEHGTLCDFVKLQEIKKEIINTMLRFDIKKVIDNFF